MVKRVFTVLILAYALLPVSVYAECLVLSDESLDEKRSDYGLVTAEWSATVQNNCEEAYDGTLNIKLLDKDEQVMQKITDIVILRANETKESRRSITIPAESIDEVDRIDVEIRERERPR